MSASRVRACRYWFKLSLEPACPLQPIPPQAIRSLRQQIFGGTDGFASSLKQAEDGSWLRRLSSSCPAAAFRAYLCCRPQSSKAQVRQLCPALQHHLGFHRGQKLRHLYWFWAGFCRPCLAFCCHCHIASLKLAEKCNSRVQRQFYSWNLLACSKALGEMDACLDGNFPAGSTSAPCWRTSDRALSGSCWEGCLTFKLLSPTCLASTLISCARFSHPRESSDGQVFWS